MTDPPRVRLGTRGSALARWQADWVASRLSELGAAVDLLLITTQGDVKSGPIGQLGTQGVFTKEIQRALLEGEVDVAVHSLKDLPTETVPGLTLAACPPRGADGDVLVARDALTLEQLPVAARVGTGSMRRRAQLLYVRPDLSIVDVRGNVESRLRKLDLGQYDALVLAEAGLTRLHLAGRITQRLARSVMLPAVGQGALGIETRSDDDRVRELVGQLNDASTWAAVTAERALLSSLRAGCLAPLGAWGRLTEGQLQLEAAVFSPDGQRCVRGSGQSAPQEAAELGRVVAEQLLGKGAGELIALARA